VLDMDIEHMDIADITDIKIINDEYVVECACIYMAKLLRPWYIDDTLLTV
jgi:hypothetical protein